MQHVPELRARLEQFRWRGQSMSIDPPAALQTSLMLHWMIFFLFVFKKMYKKLVVSNSAPTVQRQVLQCSVWRKQHRFRWTGWTWPHHRLWLLWKEGRSVSVTKRSAPFFNLKWHKREHLRCVWARRWTGVFMQTQQETEPFDTAGVFSSRSPAPPAVALTVSHRPGLKVKIKPFSVCLTLMWKRAEALHLCEIWNISSKYIKAQCLLNV